MLHEMLADVLPLDLALVAVSGLQLILVFHLLFSLPLSHWPSFLRVPFKL